MRRQQSTRRMRARAPCRSGFSYRGLLLVLSVVLAVPVVAFFLLPRFSWSSPDNGPMTHRAERENFLHEITQRGNIESASNVEIRCEVKAKGQSGTTILEIVPEGTYVQPGDVLVKLDSAALENERTQQQIVCNTSEATVIQAQNNYDTAVIAKREYLEGQYVLDRQKILSEILLAEEDYRRAEEYFTYSERLLAKGYITKLQLEADDFAKDKADNEKKSARTKLEVLDKFTKEKMHKQLESDINIAKAKLRAEEDSHKLDEENLALTEEQIAKCVIKAPESGQVVYANETDRRGGSEVIIEPGTLLRERQAIIRLPDPKRMQVKAKINEAKITLVEKDMAATIRMDAFPDLELVGVVEKVNEYPAPTSWYNASVKEYETTIRIIEPSANLRPGLTAEVKIHVEHIEDVLQVPVQAVFEHGGKHYCLLCDEDQWEARQVKIGSTNDKFVVIRGGLKPNEEVVLNTTAYRDKVELPELSSKTKDKPMVARRGPRKRSQKSQEPQETARGPTPPGRGRDARGKEGSARPNSSAIVGTMLARLDKNGNGQLERDELPDEMRSRLSAADANGDGVIDRGELTAAISRFAQGGQPGGRRPGARQ